MEKVKRHGIKTYPYPYPYPNHPQCLQQPLFRWIFAEFCLSHIAAAVH